jgi:hypothetical protein
MSTDTCWACGTYPGVVKRGSWGYCVACLLLLLRLNHKFE